MLNPDREQEEKAVVSEYQRPAEGYEVADQQRR